MIRVLEVVVLLIVASVSLIGIVYSLGEAKYRGLSAGGGDYRVGATIWFLIMVWTLGGAVLLVRS